MITLGTVDAVPHLAFRSTHHLSPITAGDTNNGHQTATEGHQGPPRATSGHQEPPAATKGHQWPSAPIVHQALTSSHSVPYRIATDHCCMLSESWESHVVRDCAPSLKFLPIHLYWVSLATSVIQIKGEPTSASFRMLSVPRAPLDSTDAH